MAPAGRVQAQNSLSLQATPTQVTVGEQFQVSLNMDFSDSTAGGGVTLTYDPAGLSLDSIALGIGDTDFQCPGSAAVACPNDPDYISFGGVTGLTGQATVATITFTSAASGTLVMALEPTNPFGGVGGGELAVDFDGTAVDSAAVAVPLLSSWGIIWLVGVLVASTLLVDRRRRVGLPTALTLVFLMLVFSAPRVAAQGSE
ncbi:MAG: cohesin domain-containing protein, partial [Myxococcota bacterium]